MRDIYTIYRVYCICNGKSYVGFTSDLEARKISHEHNSKFLEGLFYNAIRKYGWNSFEWSVLYQSYDFDHCLNIMEPWFIKEYKSLMPNGYNMTLGGEGTIGFKFNPNQLKNLSESHKGLKASEETRAKMRESRSGDLHPMFGRKHTEESREKNSLSNKKNSGKNHNQYGKSKSLESRQKMAEKRRLWWIKQKSTTHQ